MRNINKSNCISVLIIIYCSVCCTLSHTVHDWWNFSQKHVSVRIAVVPKFYNPLTPTHHLHNSTIHQPLAQQTLCTSMHLTPPAPSINLVMRAAHHHTPYTTSLHHHTPPYTTSQDHTPPYAIVPFMIRQSLRKLWCQQHCASRAVWRQTRIFWQLAQELAKT